MLRIHPVRTACESTNYKLRLCVYNVVLVQSCALNTGKNSWRSDALTEPARELQLQLQLQLSAYACAPTPLSGPGRVQELARFEYPPE